MELYTSRQTSGNLPVVVETPDHIVIEGTAYDKVTLNPMFLKNLEINMQGNNTLNVLTNRFWSKWTTTSWQDNDFSSVKFDGGSGIAKQMWRSNYDNVCYLMPAGWSYSRFVSIRMDGTNVKLWDSSMDSANVHSGLIFDESPTRVWMMNRYMSGSTDRSHIFYYFDKAVGPGWNGPNWSYVDQSNIQLLYKSDTYVYFHVTGRSDSYYGRHLLYSFNRANGTITNLLDTQGAGQRLFPAPTFARDHDVSSWIKYYYVVFPQATGILVKRMEINDLLPTTAPTVRACTINYDTGYSSTDIMTPTVSVDGRYVYQTFIINTTSNKKYLAYCLYEKTIGGNETNDRFCLYVFDIDYTASVNGDIIKLIWKMQLPGRLRTVLNVDTDFRDILCIYDSFVQFMRFNPTTKRYDVKSTIAANTQSLGFDELDRLWIYTQEGRLMLISQATPANISVSWASSSYDYTGSNIATNIVVSAYDILGVRVATSVLLTIDTPNATFGTSKTKTITTLTTGDLSVPITITGPGLIRILTSSGI